MMNKAFFLFALFISFPASADALIDRTSCQHLIAHVPAADVEYQPGADVHGKPVIEADLAPTVVLPPQSYTFDLSVDVAKNIGLQVPQGLTGEAKVGTVTVEKDRLLFNGEPMEGQAEAALKALCDKPEKARTYND